MSRRRARLDRIARSQPSPEPVVDAETRAWADSLCIYIAPDEELRALHRTHTFTEPTPEELAEWCERLGVDLTDE